MSFAAAPGTFVAIAGAGGSGKSTILGVVAGFERPDAGTVRLNGVDVHGMARSDIERQIGWLGAVVVSPGRRRRPMPTLMVGDEPEAAFVVEVSRPRTPLAALYGGGERRRLNERLEPLLMTIGLLRAQAQAVVVVVATTHPLLVKAADQVVRL